jgi:hypothetical protein
MNVPFVYQPTPLEEAYGIYLLHQVFGINCSIDGNFRISGRQAVPFLTTSGVHRMVLRTVWSVADPQTVGSLVDLKQWCLVLRLVSMAQNNNIFNEQSTCDNLMYMVQQCAGQMYNLPTFQNVMIPAGEVLMARYYGGTATINNTATAQLGYPQQQQQQQQVPDAIQQQSQQIPDYFQSGLNVSDAFSDMGPTSNAPLQPQMQSNEFGGLQDTGSVANSASNPQPQLNDFGGFQDTGSVASSNPQTMQANEFGGFQDTTTLTSSVASMSQPQSNYDEFGGFQETVKASIPQPQANDFGGFQNMAGAPLQQSNNTMGGFQIQPTSQSVDEFGGFQSQQPASQQPSSDEFGGFQDKNVSIQQPNQQLGGFQDNVGQQQQQQQQQQPQANAYSGLQQQQPANEFGALQQQGMDAFGSLVEVQDKPLPSLEQVTSGSRSLDGDDVPFQSAINESGGLEDEFGGFNGPAPTTSASVLDAFGGMQVQDAPLAPLDQQAPIVSDVEEPEDEFGGFEGVSGSGSASIHDSVANQGGGASVPGADADDPFAAVSGATDAPLPPFFGSHSQDDEFSAFEGATRSISATGSASVHSELNQTSTIVTGADPDDPFAAVYGATDAPLPALGSHSQGADDDDDFGGFEGVGQADDEFSGFEGATRSISATGSASVHSELNQTSTIVTGADADDPFAAVSGATDAPLPALGSHSQGADDDDDFGGFEGVGQADDEFSGFEGPAPSISAGGSAFVPSRLNQASTIVTGADADDPFAAVYGATDAPLPALGIHSQGADGDNDFGGFEGVAQTDDVASAHGADPFAAVSDATDAPLPTLESHSHGADYDFRGVHGVEGVVPLAEEGTSGKLHQPLPFSRDVSGTDTWYSTHTQSSDSGDFEDAIDHAQHLGTGVVEQKRRVDTDLSDDPFSVFDVVPNTQMPPPTSIFVDRDPSPSEPQHYQATSVAIFGGFDESVPDKQVNQGAENADNFGDFEGRTSSEAQDQTTADKNFGDFGGATQSASQENESHLDAFGAFDGSTATVSEPSGQRYQLSSSSGASQQPQDVEDNFGDADDDAFGDFGAASPVESQGTVDDDEFGDFGGTSNQQQQSDFDQKKTNFDASNGGPSSQAVEEDDFAAFVGAPASAEAHDDIGDFGSSAPASHETHKPIEDDEFGDFDGAALPEGKEPPEFHGSDEAEFGAFDSATTSETTTKENIDFLAVGAVHQCTSSTADDWGEFETVAAPFPQTETDTDFDVSFGDFADATVTSAQDTTSGASPDCELCRDKIRSMATLLPEVLLRQTGSPGHRLDLGECFEVNIGLDLPLDKDRKKKTDRCIQLLELLSTSHTKLASTYWPQVLTVIRDELTVGISLLEETKKLPSRDVAHVRQPIHSMISGLSEYVRVSRSIVATVGDLLMLDPSALLTIDTWSSSWCSIGMIENALEIEKLWKNVQQIFRNVTLLGSPTDNDTSLQVARATSAERYPSIRLCQLTLRPLSNHDKNTTKSPVEWKEKAFFACSANILAHRCPFYIVE